jgi:hypothetical protein
LATGDVPNFDDGGDQNWDQLRGKFPCNYHSADLDPSIQKFHAKVILSNLAQFSGKEVHNDWFIFDIRLAEEMALGKRQVGLLTSV